jgi:hypothetical protein
MPIRIIRVKRPEELVTDWSHEAQKLLREISQKLRAFTREQEPYPPVAICYGCGKWGVTLCVHCQELQDAATRKCARIWAGVEARFARARFQ